MFPLFAALLPTLSSPLVMIVIGVFAYFALSRYAGPVVANNVATSLLAQVAPRASNLLRFIDSLGVPFLSPLLQSVALGKFTDVPTQVMTIFDQLDDKTSRQQILANLAKSLVRDQLADPAKRDPLLAEIEKTLGVKITLPT